MNMTEKSIGAVSTSIHKSIDGQCGLMASTVEVKIDGRKAPNQIAIWLEEGESFIRAEFDKETIRQFIDELHKLI